MARATIQRAAATSERPAPKRSRLPIGATASFERGCTWVRWPPALLVQSVTIRPTSRSKIELFRLAMLAFPERPKAVKRYRPSSEAPRAATAMRRGPCDGAAAILTT